MESVGIRSFVQSTVSHVAFSDGQKKLKGQRHVSIRLINELSGL